MIAEAVGISLGTLVSEDLAFVSAMGLARAGVLPWGVACLASGLGIFLGDLLLFLAGRSGKYVVAKSKAAATMQRWAKSRWGVGSVLVARFIPGTRFATYVAAGASGMSLMRFALLTGGAVTAWTALGVFVGQRFPARWSFGLLLALGTLALAVFAWRMLRNADQRARTWQETRILYYRLLRYRHFEFWPMELFYPPVVVYFIGLAVWYRSLRAPFDANPGIPNGGVVGESKSFILSTMPDLGDAGLKFNAFELDQQSLLPRVTTWMNLVGIQFPIILKPDIGQRGSGVRVIESAEGIEEYARGRSFRVIAQEYSPYPEEVGINYVRAPNESRGRIVGVTRKRFPTLTGDGVSTLTELILRDERARYMASTYLKRHEAVRDRVLEVGEVFRLVESGNHCQGAVFEDGAALMTPALEAAIDRFASQIPGFHVGRFDLRFESESRLRAGRDFKVIELNGAAGEATQIYDRKMRLVDAYRILFRQLDLLFQIGTENRANGLTTSTSFVRDWLAYLRESRHHPPTT